MATADLSIYSNLLAPPKSVNDYSNENALAASNQLKLRSQQQTFDEAQAVAGEKNALRQALSQGLDPTTPEGRLGLYKVAPTMAPGILETMQKQMTSQAVANKDNAQAKGYGLDQKIKATEFQLQKLGSITSPDQVQGWLQQGVSSGAMTTEEAQSLGQSLPQAMQQPGGFDKWRQAALQGGMSAKEQLSQQQAMTIANQTNKTSIDNNIRTNDTHVQTTGMTNATSRANNAATIAKDYKVNGLDPQTGNFVSAGAAPDAAGANPMAGMIDALGQYKLAPSQAFARMQPGMKAQVIAAVQQKYPDYDPTTFDAKTKASRDFTSGSQGNALRSFAVAGQHLDQLNGLIDALDNGNMQLANKIGNAYATQTGNPAPTNFDAAKDVVSKEVVKAIVAGGGGVEERRELANLMSQAKSPAQLKGVISQFRSLMAAQHDALMMQRRAAGLPDSTAPQYHTEQAAEHPADIADLLNKYGKKK